MFPPPLLPCEGEVFGVFPFPAVPAAKVGAVLFEPAPPPEPPLFPFSRVALNEPPAPPPVEVIVEKIESLPFDPLVVELADAVPPPPTVIV
jgi:hypothetical protein